MQRNFGGGVDRFNHALSGLRHPARMFFLDARLSVDRFNHALSGLRRQPTCGSTGGRLGGRQIQPRVKWIETRARDTRRCRDPGRRQIQPRVKWIETGFSCTVYQQTVHEVDRFNHALSGLRQVASDVIAPAVVAGRQIQPRVKWIETPSVTTATKPSYVVDRFNHALSGLRPGFPRPAPGHTLPVDRFNHALSGLRPRRSTSPCLRWAWSTDSTTR